MEFKKVYCVLVVIITICDCDEILGIFNMPSNSHHILGESLLKALASKGHEVTMLSPFRSTNIPNNYKEVLLPELIQMKQGYSKKIVENMNSSWWNQAINMSQSFDAMHNVFFTSTNVQHMINSKKRYDLAIVTYFGNDPILAFAQHLANHTIIFSTLGSFGAITKITKAPAPTSYVPMTFSSLPDEMSFFQRVKNFWLNSFMELYFLYGSYTNQKFINEYLPNAPSIKEMYNHVSLALLNSDYSVESPRPYVPNMIQIGGLHVEESKPLSKDLQSFMDDAKEGVIYFSLGSNIEASDFDNLLISEILKCFSKLPYNVLWKFDNSGIINLPKNVKVDNWLPQRDLLAHKNLKLFITHGGLLSTTEALYHGVPMIGIPFFGDQDNNVQIGVTKGYLVRLPYKDLSEKSLTNAIMEVMNNSRYRENAHNLSRIIKDRPMKPLDTAVYWVEYVLRHNGAHHLKTSALKLNFFQEYLIDVVAFIALVLFISCYLILYLFKLVRSLCKKLVKKSDKRKTKLKTK